MGKQDECFSFSFGKKIKSWVSMIKFLYLFLLSSTILIAQSNSSNRRSVVMAGNNIQTVVSNYGVVAQPGSITPQGAWNGSANKYLNDNSIIVSLQLPLKDYNGNGSIDTIHSAIITPVDRPGGGEFGNGKFWGFEPVNGFFTGSSGFAISNNPSSWPSVWPDHPEYPAGSWNGYLGANTFVGDLEAFYQIDDRNDEEFFELYGFLPDSTNPAIKGHGIRISVRYVQLNHPLYEDVLFKIYDIENESLHDYEKLIFGELTGTFIGGANPEWNDDATLYYPNDNLIITSDFGNEVPSSINPDWSGKVGMFGETFISAPGNNKLASVNYFVPAGDITMSNDLQMWNRLKPGNYQFPQSIQWGQDSIPYAINGEDGDYHFGSSYFSLASGETKRIASVIAFDYNRYSLLQKVKAAEALFNNDFDTSVVYNSISLTNINSHLTIYNTFEVKWNSAISGGSVEVWFSTNFGESWKKISDNVPNNGSYNWNTNSVEDCSFGLLKVFVKDNEGRLLGFSQSHPFTINNPGNGFPFIKILTEFNENTLITSDQFEIEALTGDPEFQNLIIDIYYSVIDSFYNYSQSLSVQPDTVSKFIPVNFKIIPNSNNLSLKFIVSDGEKSYEAVTDNFKKHVNRTPHNQSHVQNLNWHSDAFIEVRVADSSAFNNHKYFISFDDTTNDDQKYYSIYDNTSGQYIVNNEPLGMNSETVMFGGMTLYAEDFKTEFNEERSGWNINRPNNLLPSFNRFTSPIINGYREPVDYIIPFSDSYNDSSDYLFGLLGPNAPPANTNINFKVFEKRKDEINRVKFIFTEASPVLKDTLSYADQITFSDETGSKLTWKAIMLGDNSPYNNYIPAAGDTLYLYTKKGLSVHDTLVVYGPLLTGNNDKPAVVKNYKLQQNYPNPFNPSTVIEYSLPEKGLVSLKVYNILGQEVLTLVNEVKEAGNHKIDFNTGSLNKQLSTGVYIYRLEAGKYISAKKMIFLK